MTQVPSGDGAPSPHSVNRSAPALDEAPRTAHLRPVGECEAAPRPKKHRPKKSAVTAKFFDAAHPHSIVKARIVAAYFMSWARIMKRQTRSKRLAYIDLYAGPGVYADGTESTPMMVMRSVLSDDELPSMLLAWFADADESHVEALKANLASLPGIKAMRFRPEVALGSAHEHGIAEAFESQHVVPTFMFLDPFGYHGLSAKLMRAILKDFGCEIAFFFKYTRIRAALTNKVVREEMDAIFGHDRVEALKTLLPTLPAQKYKERAILQCLEEALNDIGGKYVLTFRFLDASGNVTHHLIFVTKHELAHDIMKGIMANASTEKVDGVATFEFRPAAPEQAPAMLPLFDDASSPIEVLKAELLGRYRGKTILMEDIYREHNYKRPYVRRNYQDALEQLWREDKLSAYRDPSAHATALNVKTKSKLPQQHTFIVFDKV